MKKWRFGVWMRKKQSGEFTIVNVTLNFFLVILNGKRL